MSIDSDFRRFAEQVNMQVKDVVKDTSYKIFRDIVSKTAVDQGTLKSSNTIQANAPDLNYVAPVGSTQVPVPNVSGLTDNDPSVFITNNQPYAKRVLVDGWSDQTPENMINDAVQRAYNDIRNGNL